MIFHKIYYFLATFYLCTPVLLFLCIFLLLRSNLPIYVAKTIGLSSDLQQSAVCLFLLTNRRLHWLNY